MALPNPGMSFTPFDILTAEEMNDLVENIEALQDWSAFDDGDMPASKIDFTTFPMSKSATTASTGLTIDTTARVIYTNSQAYPIFVNIGITSLDSLANGTQVTARYNATSGNAVGVFLKASNVEAGNLFSGWVLPGDSIYWQASAGSDNSATTFITEFWFG